MFQEADRAEGPGVARYSLEHLEKSSTLKRREGKENLQAALFKNIVGGSSYSLILNVFVLLLTDDSKK